VIKLQDITKKKKSGKIRNLRFTNVSWSYLNWFSVSF